MTLPDITEPSIAPITAVIISAAISLNGLFLKWLLSSFSDLRKEIRSVNDAVIEWLDKHELLDQKRHEDNLYRFEKISVALARLGADNGTHEKKI